MFLFQPISCVSVHFLKLDTSGTHLQEVEKSFSIVPDMLDFLNESWTPFHATGDSYPC